MNTDLYVSLLEACPKSTFTITDEDDTVNCFELTKSPQLKAVVEPKFPTTKYVHIEHLLFGDGESGIVLNISLYDEDGEHVGGAELSLTNLIWDDAE